MQLQRLVIEKLCQFLDLIPNEKCFVDGIFQIDSIEMQISELGLCDDVNIAVSAKVCTLSPEVCARILMITMSANHFWRGTAGATFSYEPKTETLYLSKYFRQTSVTEMCEIEIGEAFLGLYESTQYWQSVLDQLDNSTQGINDKSHHTMSFGQAAARLQ